MPSYTKETLFTTTKLMRPYSVREGKEQKTMYQLKCFSDEICEVLLGYNLPYMNTCGEQSAFTLR
jgi:hypothetical protein